MKLSRNVTIVTANLGRGASIDEFKENVRRLKEEVPGKNRFFGFQEIDEADTPSELKILREVFGETHQFAGTKTHVPIAIPRTFTVSKRESTVASEGVDGLSPRRHVVQATVHPDGHPSRKIIATNTHFARDTRKLLQARSRASVVLQQQLRTEHPSWLTADLNSQGYRPLAFDEKRFVTARLDYIRGYERADVKLRLLNVGSVNLTIDGHNAHWARVQITWP